MMAVHATVLIIIVLSATVACMNLPEKFVDRVMQDVIAEILEDEFQNPGREQLMNRVEQDWLNVTKCKQIYDSGNLTCSENLMDAKSADMLNGMTSVAEMNEPLNYTEHRYLSNAIAVYQIIKYIRYER